VQNGAKVEHLRRRQGYMYVVEGHVGAAPVSALASRAGKALGDDVAVVPESLNARWWLEVPAVRQSNALAAGGRGVYLFPPALETQIQDGRVVLAFNDVGPGRGVLFAVVQQRRTQAEAD
jgi:hypothetical protein